MAEQCVATAQSSGNRCRNRAMMGSGYCYFHSLASRHEEPAMVTGFAATAMRDAEVNVADLAMEEKDAGKPVAFVRSRTPFEDLTLSEFLREIGKVQQDTRDTLTQKRRSYGPGNLTKFGELGILVRAADKVERLTNMLYGGYGSGDGESIDDAWRDLMGYATLAMIYRACRRPKGAGNDE